jgi:hypothetical protein
MNSRAALICLLTATLAAKGTTAIIGEAEGGCFWCQRITYGLPDLRAHETDYPLLFSDFAGAAMYPMHSLPRVNICCKHSNWGAKRSVCLVFGAPTQSR